MNRLPFLKWNPLDWFAALFIAAIIGTVFVAIYYGTWKPIGIIAVIFFGILMMAIVNSTNDRVEKAKNSRSPPGPDEILSFSLEHELRNKNVLSFSLEHELKNKSN